MTKPRTEAVRSWRARNPERYAEQRFNEKLKRAGLNPAVHNPSYKPAKPFELLRRGVAQKPHLVSQNE